MADAPDSKSGGGNPVRVQVSPPAPNKIRYLVPSESGFSGWCVRSLCPNCAQTLIDSLLTPRRLLFALGSGHVAKCAVPLLSNHLR
jgi:hypothetical protein